MPTTRIARVLGLLMVLAMVVSACGAAEEEPTSESEPEADVADATDEEDAEPTEPAADETTEDEPADEPATDEATEDEPAAGPADGEPIVMGFINQEDTPAGSFPEQREAVEAALAYINEELGGVEGRPIEMVVELTEGTPESSSSAATALLEQDPVLVMPGTDFGTFASIPIFEDAGMPYVGGVPLLPPELTSPISFAFAGGNVAAFPSQSWYIATELGADKVSIIYTDNPAGLEAAQTFSQSVLESLGVSEVNLIPEDAAAADFTPAVSAANDGDTDAIMVLFAAAGCSRIMQAVAALGIDTPMWYPGSCLDSDVLEAGGEGAEGAYFNSEHIVYTDTSDEDVALYREVMERYRPDAKVSSYSQSAFAAMMNVYDIMVEIGADNLSPQAIIDALNETVDHDSFMSHPYTCAGEPIPGLPSVCNAAARIVQIQDGEPVDLFNDWILGYEYMPQ